MKLAANASIFSSIEFVPTTVFEALMGQSVILYNTVLNRCNTTFTPIHCIDTFQSIQYIAAVFPNIVF